MTLVTWFSVWLNMCWSWSLLHRESVRPQKWSQLILRWSNSWSNAGLHNQTECLVHHKTHNRRMPPYPHRSPMPPLASLILPVPASLLSSAFKIQHHLHVLKHQGKYIQNIADCAYIIIIYMLSFVSILIFWFLPIQLMLVVNWIPLLTIHLSLLLLHWLWYSVSIWCDFWLRMQDFTRLSLLLSMVSKQHTGPLLVRSKIYGNESKDSVIFQIVSNS